jgi:hypothetical protein
MNWSDSKQRQLDKHREIILHMEEEKRRLDTGIKEHQGHIFRLLEEKSTVRCKWSMENMCIKADVPGRKGIFCEGFVFDCVEYKQYD